MDDRRDASHDLYLAFVIGAVIAFYLVLPPPLKTAAFHGALIGKVIGLLFGLGRRHLAKDKPSWLRSLIPVPLFGVGCAAGFVLVTWLAATLPAFISRIAS